MGMILKGDCIEVMKAMKPNSVDAIVCDPPYGLEFMGKEWDKLRNNWQAEKGRYHNDTTFLSKGDRIRYKAGLEMQLWHTQWLTEAYRVLKPGGSMLVMGGSDSCFGVGNKYRPETLSKGRFPANIILSHHPECVQVGVKRVKPHNGSGKSSGNTSKEKSMFGVESTAISYLAKDGLETVESWDCHRDCAVRMLDEQSGDKCGGRWSRLKTSKRTPGTSFDCGVKNIENANQYIGDSGGASRFFYCAKASRGERNAGLGDSLINGDFIKGRKSKKFASSRPSGVLYNNNEQAFSQEEINKNNHPTVKPIKLFEWLIKLVIREGQIVLDPFIGSGTTAIAAHNTGRKCVGIEKEDEYLEIAKRRIDYWENQFQQVELKWA